MRRILLVVLSFVVCLTSVSLAGEKYWDTGGWATVKEYEQETGKKIAKFNEAPMLKQKVAKGELPLILLSKGLLNFYCPYLLYPYGWV